MNIILKKSFIVKVEGMIIMKGDELLDAHSASATNIRCLVVSQLQYAPWSQ